MPVRRLMVRNTTCGDETRGISGPTLLAALLVFACMLASGGGFPAAAQDNAPTEAEQAALTFVRDVAAKNIATAFDEGASLARRRSVVLELYQDHFATAAIAQFLLGRHWGGTSEAERADYVAVLDGYITSTIASIFPASASAIFRYFGADELDDGGRDRRAVMVRTVLVTDEISVRLDWRIERFETGLKVTDVIISDISLLLTQRDLFQTILNGNGGSIGGLNAELRQRVNFLIDPA